jgi:LuxR family transcriptional regulator, maltose regulon positive regulatory protein
MRHNPAMASLAATERLQHQLPRQVVPRAALEGRLDDVVDGGMGLLVASAGSGKSVLVGQWSSARPDLHIAGLALTSRHDDAVALAGDVVAAIRSVAPEVDPAISGLVTTGGAALGDAFVAGLREGLAALPHRLVLVLEDVHVPSNRAVLEDLGRLLTTLPDTARAIVTTRRDLPWPLHRLRLADKVVEVRGADLAFRSGEARALLESVSGHGLTDELVTALVDRTDGWAVGLQLAAISLRTAPDGAAFVESFAGSDRLVSEYLVDEVIESQEPDVRRFLLQTSVLDRLSAELCDAVTGAGNASAMLGELYRRSMFLIPLDMAGTTFRYHHLFAEVLRYRLKIEAPGTVDGLHRRAASWLIQHGHEEEAVGHLLDAHDTTEALKVITTVGHRLFERGEAATLVRWLSAVGAEAPDAPAVVEINLLAAQIGADDSDAAAETYRRILRRPGLTLGERAAAHTLHTSQVFRDLAPEAVLELTDEVRSALAQLGSDDAVDFLGVGGTESIRVMSEHAAAISHFLMGDLDEAATVLERVRTMPGMSYPMWRVYASSSLALVRAWQGHSTEAAGLARSAIELARSFGATGHQGSLPAHLAMALVHLDRVALDVAERSLDEAMVHISARPTSFAYFDLHAALEARLVAIRDGPVEALALLRAPTASSKEAPVLREARQAWRARLLIGTGDFAGARALLNRAPVGPVLAPARIDLALAAADTATARATFDAWQPAPNDLSGEVRRLLRCFAILKAEGDYGAAEAALTEAVAAASGDRLRWPFLEVPAALRALRMGKAGNASWLTSDALWGLAVLLEPCIRAQDSLVEPLTQRELDVLTYLPGRMRNQDIAADLFVSVNTVKTHLASIYRKLRVTERNDAIERARQLRLL